MKEYTIGREREGVGPGCFGSGGYFARKNDAIFQENVAPDIKLIILNVEQIKLTGQKSKQKEYKSYSGYPGSLKFIPIAGAIEKKGMAYVLERLSWECCRKQASNQNDKNLILK